MTKKEKILQYCREQDKPLTARQIVEALYPGKKQPYVNGEINRLVQEKKLARTATSPYTVYVPQSDQRKARHTNSRQPAIKINRPSPAEVDRYLKAWNELENYRLQEAALDKLFFELCPENRCIEDILIKVAALNDFYSTHIFSTYPMAKQILALGIDERLKAGDLSLINEMAAVQMPNGSTINFYSFATKYCSHHQPKKFAIYDNYVEKILKYFRDRDHYAKFSEKELKSYPKFSEVLNQFRQFYGLEAYDLKQTDRYLWQLGKAAFPRKYYK
jgi:hypothetical protein